MSDGDRLLRVVRTIRETAGEPSSGPHPASPTHISGASAAEKLLTATVGFIASAEELLRAARTASGLDGALLDTAAKLAERSRILGGAIQLAAIDRLEAADIDVHPLLDAARRSSPP